MLGDLGLVQISELPYSSMPDAMITPYSAPEVRSGDAVLSETMDIYSVGVILYEVYNGGELPLDEQNKLIQTKKSPLAAPKYADVALSEIILKACARKPEDRCSLPLRYEAGIGAVHAAEQFDKRACWFPPPVEVKPEKAPDDASVDMSEIAATIEAGQAAEHPDQVEKPEPDAPEVPVVEEKPKAPKRRDWRRRPADSRL